MGYTHYWGFKIDEKISVFYSLAVSTVKAFLEERISNGAELAGPDGTGTPQLEPDILINSIDDQAHETFCLPGSWRDAPYQEFCKTARKPYDTIVVACLHILDRIINDQEVFNWSSDGDEKDHAEGKELAEQFLKKHMRYPNGT